jgi:putative transcriptional regulator
MSTAFDDIRKGMEEAIAFAGGNTRGAVVHEPRPVDVKKLRGKLGMTQERFAATFGIGLGTLRHWERGDRTPRGPALTLLNVVEKKPEAVLEALS